MPTHARDDLPLTPLSRTPLGYRCVPFRGARGPIPSGSPRPLPPRRREATKLFPAESAFVRQEMRCSSSVLSNGDCAPCTPGICLRELLLGSRAALADNPSRPCVVLRTPPAGNRSSCRLRLPSPRLASQRRVSFDQPGRIEQRTRPGTIRYIRRPRPPSTMSPAPLSESYVREKGFSEPLPDRLSTSAMRQTAYGHIHEIASAPASRLRSPCEAWNPPAFAVTNPCRAFAKHERRGQRAVCSTVEAGLPRPPGPPFDEPGQDAATDRLS